jgi:AcrR family transcriptional regulator
MPLWEPSRREPIEHARRRQIIAAANDHFRRYGYEKTTVGDLAKAIGFSKAYVYRFFASKQAIGEAICGLCLDRITADLQDVASSDAPASERLRAIFRTLARRVRETADRESKLQDIIAAAHQGRWPCLMAHEALLSAIVMRVIDDGRRTGEFERRTPADAVCRGILLLLQPLRDPVYIAQKREGLSEQAESLASLALRSLAA